MTREDYIKEVARFESVLKALDATHRLNGHIYTPIEIRGVRKAVRLLKQVIEVGVYDTKGVTQ